MADTTTILLDTPEFRDVEITHTDDKGAVIATTNRREWKPGTPQANADTLVAKADAALAANATFLAKANPTAAENAAQAKALTRQVNGVIRLLLGRLEDTAGT